MHTAPASVARHLQDPTSTHSSNQECLGWGAGWCVLLDRQDSVRVNAGNQPLQSCTHLYMTWCP